MKISVLIFCLILGFTVQATNYYLSTSGDDGKDGKSPANAWKTITKVNSSMSLFNPGDSILFKRGEVFRGQLNAGKSGSYGTPIVFAAYGFGVNPIISGAVVLGENSIGQSSPWVQVGTTGIWRCYYNTGSLKLTQLFVNNEKKFISRYPNTGYLYVDANGTPTTFNDADIGKSGAYFSGSRIAILVMHDKWMNKNVISVDGGKVVTEDLGSNALKDAGYYFYGNYNMIDQVGEWYFKDAVDSMYYMPPAGVDPNTQKIEASLHTYCIDTKFYDNLVFKNLIVERAAMDGINFNGTANGVFSNLTIRDIYYRALFSNNWNGANPEHKSNFCTISDCNIINCQFGLSTYRTFNTTVTHNNFKNIGTEFIGYVSSYVDAIGLDMGGMNTVSYNVIDRTAKNGIRLADSLCVVEKNIISNVGLGCSDLAGIYLGKSDKACVKNIVRNNFVFDTQTNSETWKNNPSSYQTLSPGLYNDLWGKDNRWEKNTIFNTGMGILCQNEISALYYRNIIYNFSAVGMNFVERPPSDEPVGFAKNNKLIGNIWYKTQKQNTRLFQFENKSATKDWGTFISEIDSNRYIYPYENPYLYIGYFPADNYKWISLNEWKNRFPADTHSKVSQFSIEGQNPDQSVLFTNMSDQVKTVALSGTWYDLDGKLVGSQLTVEPWYSAILVKGANAGIVTSLIPDEKSSRFKIYPNPVSGGQLTVEMGEIVENGKIELFDLSGRKLAEKLINGEALARLDIDRKRRGVCLIKVSTDSEVRVQKVIIK